MALVGLSSSQTARAQQPASAIELKVVKYADLVATVKAQHGKVVVVDVWGTFCVPCKKEFPRLVQLHQQYAKDGLVCMSVTVDTPDKQEAALNFLKAKGATFANYLLNEEAEVWQSKWKLKGVPAVFVFDREGKLAMKYDNDDDHQFTYDDVEQLVKKLLAKKA
jgi:thiol-disulfide isomerase/thioredoxin